MNRTGKSTICDKCNKNKKKGKCICIDNYKGDQCMLDRRFREDIKQSIITTKQLIVDNKEKMDKLCCAIEKENNKLQRLLKDAKANKVALEQRLEALLQVLDTASYPKT